MEVALTFNVITAVMMSGRGSGVDNDNELIMSSRNRVVMIMTEPADDNRSVLAIGQRIGSNGGVDMVLAI